MKKVSCRVCRKRTANDVARLCDDCLKEQGQMTIEEAIAEIEGEQDED